MARVHIEMINLARATDRRAHMEAELSRAGLSAAFHPAFDYKVEGEEAMLAHCTRTGPWGTFQPGNMACTISHAQAWERFMDTDADYCLVLEDDVHISPQMGAWLADMSWWPADAQLVKIERWNGRNTKVLLSQGGTTYMGRAVQRLHGRHVGSAGYILNRAGAQTMLDHRPFRLSIDNYLFNVNASRAARSVVTYQVNPALVTQGNEPEGSTPSLTHRVRPEGWELFVQKVKRGWFEIAYPLSTWAKFITGRIAMVPVPYAAHAGAPTPNPET